MSSIDKALEKCREVVNYHVSPFRCYYFNPHKYTPVTLMKWCQKYMVNRMYMILLRAASITGYEVVPSELLMRNGARDGYSNKIIKMGKISFYLLKQEEMSPRLWSRFQEFKQKMTN